MRRLYHFLGSITFAIPLITVAILFVIAGTFLESATDSHLFAAQWTYSHPVFMLLLASFFINILFAALRRWPYQVHHIPFLITHLGLLMILAGVMIKNSYGTQGSLLITEGSGSHELHLPNSEAVLVENIDGTRGYYLKGKSQPIQDLSIQCIGYTPNCREVNEHWIHRNHAVITGLPPFPLNHTVKAEISEGQIWNLYAKKIDDIEQAIAEAYTSNLNIRITSPFDGDIIYEGVAKDEITWENGTALIEWELPPIHDSPLARIYLDTDMPKQSLTLEIPLAGPHSLQNKNITTPYLGDTPLTVDFEQTPTLHIFRDNNDDTHLVALDKYGRIDHTTYSATDLGTLAVYNEGFGGYASVAQIPFGGKPQNRMMLNQSGIDLIKQELKRGAERPTELAAPLRVLYEACQMVGVDFADYCTEFLLQWNHTNTWLWPKDLPLPQLLRAPLDAINLPLSEIKGCEWIATLFNEIDPKLRQGKDPIELIKDNGWPLSITTTDPLDFLTEVTQQTFALGTSLPKVNESFSIEQLLTAYLRVYGIHLSTIRPEIDHPEQSFNLESPLAKTFYPADALNKMEDNRPKITLRVTEGNQTEDVAMAFDKTGSLLKWPTLSGRYRLRFQPLLQSIPYHVRLKQARQINYAGTNQPFSYEADLLLRDLRNDAQIEKTISMNNVHETWDGYRFYMASLSPSDETAVKQVQIIVNHDPARYILTYPGGGIVSLGIILLFWWNPKKKRGI